jgi:hypothetical protein
MCYWKILTDQNSGFKRGGRTNLHRTPFPNVLRLYLAERTNYSAGNVDAGRNFFADAASDNAHTLERQSGRPLEGGKAECRSQLCTHTFKRPQQIDL